MDRCAVAYAYRKQGLSCSQSVACAFADLVDMPLPALLAAAGAFGGGVGGSHEELCGAVSGGVLVIGLLTPQSAGGMESRKLVYARAREFRRRFLEVFGLTRCGELLRAKPDVTEKNPASARLGVSAHCDNMIVTAVEILEQMIEEDPSFRHAGDPRA